MIRRLYLFTAIAFALTSFFSCKKAVPVVPLTSVGPDMKINSCDENAYMGGKINFSVSLKDEFPLSTLKVKLLFDEDVVSEKVIRTKENGEYKDELYVPLFADIPDGTATLEFISQNTGLGISKKTLEVGISRPDFPFMNLKIGEKTYKMEKTGKYKYALEGEFPADAHGFVLSPEAGEQGSLIKIGWDGKKLSASSEKEIPFSAVKQGIYTIYVDLMTLTAGPFGKTALALNPEAPVEVLNLLQGTVLTFPGIQDIINWDLDFDFFNVSAENVVTFKSFDGIYKLSANFGKKFIRVEKMKNKSELEVLEDDGSGALWMIGGAFGKPVIGPSWNTDEGAYCFAESSPKVYVMTLSEGSSIHNKSFSLKVFHQKGWGGEFKSYASFNDETGLFKVTASGNIEIADGKQLITGKAYAFEIDLTEGKSSPRLHIFETVVPVSSLEIEINGVKAGKVSATIYSAILDLKKNDALSISGEITGLDTWWFDPDFIKKEGGGLKFTAMSGKYKVILYLDGSYAELRRMKDNETEAEINEGGLWLMGWGVANPVMTKQLGFSPGKAFSMAEVDNMVFQFTGTAVGEKDGKTMGGRFRVDYISAKYFGQDGWGKECGKILGNPTTVELGPQASTMLKLTNSKNIELAEGVKLEEGAVYTLTVDLSKVESKGIETIEFVKK